MKNSILALAFLATQVLVMCAPAATPQALDENSGLRVIEPQQDSQRAAAKPRTSSFQGGGWSFASFSGSIGGGEGGGPMRLLMHLGESGSAIIDDITLVAGSLPGVGYNYVANGDFETALDPLPTNGWRVGTNYLGSQIVSDLVHSGSGAFKMIGAAPGAVDMPMLRRTIAQFLSPAPAVNSINTLGFWYWVTNSATNLMIRIRNSTALTTGTGLNLTLRAEDPLFYVSEGTHAIDRISSVGVVSNYATYSGSSTLPEGLALDGAGNLYVGDGGVGRIWKIPPGGGEPVFFADTNPRHVFGLAYDAGSSNLFAALVGGPFGKIAKVSPSGVVTPFADLPVNASPFGLVFDRNGNLFTADSQFGIIYKITPDGVLSNHFSYPSGFPTGLAFDSSGNLFIADFNATIYKLTPQGVFSPFVVRPAGSGLKGLAFDRSGNLYVAEQNRNSVTRISAPGNGVTDFASLFAPQFLLLVTDTVAPVLNSPPAANLSCSEVLPPDFAGGTVTDDTDPHPVVTWEGDITNGVCPTVITRLYRATDSSGNSSLATQTITVVDNFGPLFTFVPGNTTLACHQVGTAPLLTATDNCDPHPTVQVSEARTNGICPGNYRLTRTWLARDACGNTRTAQQVITVVDTTPPFLSGQGSNEVIYCPATPMFTPPTATDLCDTSPTLTFTNALSPGVSKGDYLLTRHWWAVDACGNVSQSVSQTIEVRDRTTPVLNCPTNVVTEFTWVGGATVSFTATASDECDTNVILNFSPASASVFSIGTTTVQTSATDGSGNVNACDFLVTVLGARGTQSNVVSELAALKTIETSRVQVRRLERAIGHLQKAWADASFGDEKRLTGRTQEKLFRQHRLAILNLRYWMRLEKEAAHDAAVQSIIHSLLRSERLLAAVSIQDVETAGGAPKQIERARQHLDNGDRELARGHELTALNRYRLAWRNAVRAPIVIR